MVEALHDPVIFKTLQAIGTLLGVFGFFSAVLLLANRRDPQRIRSILGNYFAWFFILPAVLVPLAAGPLAWVVFVWLLSLLAFREYACATGLWRDRVFLWVAAACITGIFYTVASRWYLLFVVMPVYITLILLTVPLSGDRFEGMIQRLCLALLGVIYLGWCLAHFGYLIHLRNGTGHVLFVFLITELNDICAYNIGKGLGKHPLAAHISPNKTVEGTLGGLFASVGFSLLFRFLIPEFTTPHLIWIGALIALTGTLGDLAISVIKRDIGIKDMGRLIPGQGGILDRFDSLIFVAPVFFHFTVYFYKDLLPIQQAGH